ncbi:MAG TPA: AI-2E family transporter [Oligoflexia bacterium]|nr:AI-2E family transporter [Oligoflexia bacterium]HMR25484.1 AI-2E family transporter [Oligoflexia bacterium]
MKTKKGSLITVQQILLLSGFILLAIYAQTILLPLVLGTLFAMITIPIIQFFQNKGIPIVLAKIFSIVCFAVFIAIFLSGIALQASIISSKWSDIEKKITKTQQSYSDSEASKTINSLSSGKNSYFKPTLESIFQALQEAVIGLVGSFLSMLAYLGTAFLFMILIILEKERIEGFFKKLYPKDKQKIIFSALRESIETINSYVWGRLLLTGILAVVYSIFFSIIGLKFAIPVAIMVALFNIIPYAGNLISIVFLVLISLLSDNSMFVASMTIGTIFLYQFIESNILEPWILGGSVGVNPLTTVIALALFTTVWGIFGTLMAVPVSGIIRIFLSHSDHFKATAYLMSDGEV